MEAKSVFVSSVGKKFCLLLKEGKEKIDCHLQIVQPFLLLWCTCPLWFFSPPPSYSSLALVPPYDE
jgi:hypothetical protein